LFTLFLGVVYSKSFPTPPNQGKFNHQQLDILLAHRGDPWWEEVLLLYAGQTTDASSLLNQLVGPANQGKLHEDIFLTNLILAGQCLSARPTLQYPSLWETIISLMFENLTITPYSLLQERIAETLAAIDVLEVNNKLLQILSDEQLDVFVRERIASALGSLGEHSIALRLVDLLSNEQIDPSVRGNIAEMIGKVANDDYDCEAAPPYVTVK
jgi:hypothetical protein